MRSLTLLLLLLAACSGGARSTPPPTTGNTAPASTIDAAPPPASGGAHIDGKEGAICAWGSDHTDPAPPPEPCAAGLTCCYPCGIDGCDSVCMAVDDGCPRYP